MELDPFQEQAITALAEGRSVLVCAPTGTGKTIIADWIVDEALRTGQQVIYTAPVKALSNQKFRDYVRLHGEDKVGLVTGDLVIRRDAPCLVMTTEILRNMLLTGEQLRSCSPWCSTRSTSSTTASAAPSGRRSSSTCPRASRSSGCRHAVEPRRVRRLATHVRGSPVDVVEEPARRAARAAAVQQRHRPVRPAGYDRLWRRKRAAGAGQPTGPRRAGARARRRSAGRTTRIDRFRILAERDWLPYLYFVFSRRDTEILARSLARTVNGTLLSPEERAAAEARLLQAVAELGPALDDELLALYRAGIAFHHAGLHVQLKSLVEELYEAKLLKVLYCTSTFALGINMPARSVVFDGLMKYDGRRVAPLPTRGFMQKAGRAGRRGMDEVGHVVIRMDLDEYDELESVLKRYGRGAYEPVRSSFNLSFHSVLNLLEQHDHDPQRIREIVDKSFLTWHATHTLATADLGEDAPKKRRARAEVAAKRAKTRTWDEFRAKVGYLQGIGYLDDDLVFNAGARILRHLQISEVFVTELVLSGLLEDLSPPRLFGVLCGLTNELPRHAHLTGRRAHEDRGLARQVARIRQSDVVVGAEELGGGECSWDEDVMHLGRRWAEGVPLLELVASVASDTDLSGDLVTGFRRAKDLVGQLRDVYADIPDRAQMLAQLARAVSRDEVEVVG
ncbi:MAG: DEAD/DEAH box helicase [Myxococcota bacterium]